MVQRLPLTQARNALGAVVKRVHLNKEYVILEVDTTDYGKAVRAVRKLGIDPRGAAHHRPRRP